ncbi:acyltransferase [Parabacteroides merdae]|jgi:acetyltransferase-like isoleucine patch superfamily enzyme|uniref:Acyltransferase n=1 Tax=Parabacteroides merdae TaxID=46503 RepID=A0A3R6E1W1_9BACT|nr:acyltransferase [Parabacteroides merdae]
MGKNFSLTFRFLRKIGLYYSEEEYGQVSFAFFMLKIYRTYRNAFISRFLMESFIMTPISVRKWRPWLVRRMGAHVGKNVAIGDHVRIDSGHADMIYIEDYVQLTGGCRVLAHKRDLTDYHVGDNAADFGYKVEPVRLCKGCQIGMESMIMPGVTVGEGAIVGAGSLISKDIPAWTIAVGRPAKVVKEVPYRKIVE